VDSNLEKCVLQGLCGMCEEWSLRCICSFFFFPLKAVASAKYDKPPSELPWIDASVCTDCLDFLYNSKTFWLCDAPARPSCFRWRCNESTKCGHHLLSCHGFRAGQKRATVAANFPGTIAGAPLFFERNNGCSSELSPFYRYRYSLLWREWWLKEKVRKSSSVSARW